VSVGTDTRDRILAVSAELFVEQGYDGTSLREIAERLGFSKAALYYHFSSKEQILEALLEPARQLIGGLFERLDAARTVEEWAEALEWVVSHVFSNADMFRLIARNRHVVVGAVGAGTGVGSEESHLQHFERAEAAAATIAPDVAEQVRLIAALGAVTGFDDWAPTLLQTGPPEVLHAELIAATRRILGLKERSRPS
jgi:AcrR family transcriptional regulator